MSDNPNVGKQFADVPQSPQFSDTHRQVHAALMDHTGGNFKAHAFTGDLAKSTGLSVPTTASALRHLEGTGYVKSKGVSQGADLDPKRKVRKAYSVRMRVLPPPGGWKD